MVYFKNISMADERTNSYSLHVIYVSNVAAINATYDNFLSIGCDANLTIIHFIYSVF